MTPESALKKSITESLAGLPFLKLWRNNTGRKGRVSFGLAVGSSDLVGIVTTTMGIGRFIGLEIKVGKNEPTDDQKAFAAEVRALGGVAETVRSPAEALAVVMRARDVGEAEKCAEWDEVLP